MSIKLNDLLKLTDEEISRAKCRFMTPSKGINFDPLKNAATKEGQDLTNLETLVWQSEKVMNFRNGEIVIGFIPVDKDAWLMTGIVEIVDEKTFCTPAEAKYYEKPQDYNFRVVVKFHNDVMKTIRHADKILPTLEVLEIWPADKTVGEEEFKGYENVNLSWEDLAKALKRDDWQTALRSQKGVYLITDTKTNKRYVGSAYGKDMMLGRWRSYVENGHGGNVELEKLDFDYIKQNFRYTILEIYRSTVNDNDVIAREQFWKEILLTRGDFGYNVN